MRSRISSRALARYRREFQAHGYVTIPGFFTDDEVEVARRAEREAWERRRADVTVDDLVTDRRLRLADVADEDAEQHYFKVNDLFLVDDALRQVVLSDRLNQLLGSLLGDVPVVCNTLHLTKGSQQIDHLDTLFMTPRTPGALVATWMPLEDVTADAGPLRYYPESHHIDPFVFSTGSMHLVYEEGERWKEYMADEVDRRGLRAERLLARAGDLFVWHAFLLHGGCPIDDPGRTRRSLVAHFYTRTDCLAEPQRGSVTSIDGTGSFWLDHPPHPVPG